MTFLALALLPFLPALAAAQESQAADFMERYRHEVELYNAMSPFDQFQHDAGSIGLIIEGLSVVALMIIVKEFLDLRRAKLAPAAIVDEVESLLDAGEHQEALELCESEPGYFTNIVAAGLPKLPHGFETTETALQERMEAETIKLHSRISWLSLIAALSPMLGLLGTVQGMIGAFRQIAATKGQATPDMLAHNIAMALITTLLGLMVAIPVNTAFVFLRNRINASSIEIAGTVEGLFERFRPRPVA